MKKLSINYNGSDSHPDYVIVKKDTCIEIEFQCDDKDIKNEALRRIEKGRNAALKSKESESFEASPNCTLQADAETTLPALENSVPVLETNTENKKTVTSMNSKSSTTQDNEDLILVIEINGVKQDENKIEQLYGPNWSFKIKDIKLNRTAEGIRRFLNPLSLYVSLQSKNQDGHLWAAQQIKLVTQFQQNFGWIFLILCLPFLALLLFITFYVEQSFYFTIGSRMLGIFAILFGVLGVTVTSVKRFIRHLLFRPLIPSLFFAALLLAIWCPCSCLEPYKIKRVINLSPETTVGTEWLAAVQPGTSTLGWLTKKEHDTERYKEIQADQQTSTAFENLAYSESEIIEPFYFEFFQKQYVTCNAKSPSPPQIFKSAWRNSKQCKIKAPLEVRGRSFNEIFDGDHPQNAEVDVSWAPNYGDRERLIFSERWEQSLLAIRFSSLSPNQNATIGFDIQMQGAGPILRLSVSDPPYDTDVPTPLIFRFATDPLDMTMMNAQIKMGDSSVGTLTFYGLPSCDEKMPPAYLDCYILVSSGQIKQFSVKAGDNSNPVASSSNFISDNPNLSHRFPICFAPIKPGQERTVEVVLAKGWAPHKSWQLKLPTNLSLSNVRIYTDDGVLVGTLKNMPANARVIGPILSKDSLPENGEISTKDTTDPMSWDPGPNAPFSTNWFWSAGGETIQFPLEYVLSKNKKNLYCKEDAGRSCSFQRDCGICYLTLAGRERNKKSCNQSPKPEVKSRINNEHGIELKNKYKPCCKKVEVCDYDFQ